MAHLAPGTEDGAAVDHLAVSEHGFCQAVAVEASRRGAGPGPVGMDEQKLGTDHSIEVPAYKGAGSETRGALISVRVTLDSVTWAG